MEILEEVWTGDADDFNYAYDALNRLVGVEKDGNTQREYSYDAFGNRTKKVDYTIPVLSGEVESGVETTFYRYNNANQLIAEQLGVSGISGIAQEKTYHYDKRGNLTAVNQGEELLKQFTFDTANRMSGSAASADGIWKQASYLYNGLGQRVGQEIGNSLQNPEKSICYTLDLTKQYHNLLHLGDAQNRKDQTFYWDGNVVSMQEDREESFYLQDDLGSPVELLNAEGGIRENYAFDEFGTSLNFGEQMQPFGFTGYQMDVAGGLYFAQARRYDASTGRFVSEDKDKGFADAPFTLNPYSYCWNKPMELVDLNGKEAEEYYVYYLNNMDGAKVFGHSSILIENSDGTSDFYSYMGTGGTLSAITGEKSLGYMAYEHLSCEETERFLETGDIDVTMYGGGINHDNYDRALRKQITEEEKNIIIQEAGYYMDLFETHSVGDVELYLNNTKDPTYQLYSQTSHLNKRLCTLKIQ